MLQECQFAAALILLRNGFVLSDVLAGRPASIGRKIHRSAIAKNRIMDMHRHGGERWTYTPIMYKLCGRSRMFTAPAKPSSADPRWA